MNTVVKNGNKAELFVDGVFAGFIELSDEGCGTFRIENTEIEDQYRGKGLYRVLISGAFDVFGASVIRSAERNINSNWCYRNWTGNDELDQNAVVWIEKNNETLVFTEES